MQYRSRSFFSSPLFSLTMQNNVTNALFGAAPMRQSSTTLVILNLKLYTTISGQCAIDSINVAIPWLCPTPIAMFVNNMFPSWPCLPFVPCSDLLSGFSVYSIFYFNLSWWLKLKIEMCWPCLRASVLGLGLDHTPPKDRGRMPRWSPVSAYCTHTASVSSK